MDLRSGIKTTEFWITAAFVIVCAVAFFLGKINWEAFLAAAGACVGYSVSRGMSKQYVEVETEKKDKPYVN